MTPSANLLLLLGLSQALPLQEQGGKEEKAPDTVDITTRMLTSNNGSNEILLEGDLLDPRTRTAIMCYTQNCFWKKNSSGLVTVPFTLSSDFTSSENQLIVNAVQGFHSKTCIRFVPRNNETDYVSVENQSGCFSSLGKVGGSQVLSLQRQGCVYYGIIQHEFNHALGFLHQHTRSNLDNYVTINWANIDPQRAYNFDKQVTNNVNTPYDYTSIMHHFFPSSWLQKLKTYL
ncbi:high choriolytic enzyme 1-like [Perca flavescens]|uniref:high choriolytic enzyme 1-like n=1 Tax=Perca flavescens TaxID=8167 RepID=UPI00106DE149|nr:high choriolytic enzyme 1-like [Perca flavescens]